MRTALAGFRIATQLLGDAVYGEGMLLEEPLGAEFSAVALGDAAATKEILARHVLVHAAQSPRDRELDIACGEAIQAVVEESPLPL